MDKWKILKDRPHYFYNTTSSKSDHADQSDSDDDFDLPRTQPAPHHTPIQQHQQEEEQGQEAPPEQQAGPPPLPEGLAAQHGGPATPLRERWEVANGPWRVKQNKPSPRERKRRQQAARRRDKEQQTTYWLRNRGEPREVSEEESEEE